MTAGMAEVIAAHKYEFLPLVCGCGVVCGADEDELTYAAHVAEELVRAGYGNVSEAKEDAFAEAVAVLRDRSKWTRSEHGPYVVKTGYDEDGHGNAAQDVDEWYADWLEQFPYREPQHG